MKFLALIFFLLLATVWANPIPQLDGHWRLDPQATTGMYGPFNIPDLELDLSADAKPNVYHVKLYSPSKQWTLQDHYHIDGKSQAVRFVSPQNREMSGTRQLQWSVDKRSIVGVETLQTNSVLGRVRVVRKLKMYLDDQDRLIVDSQETSPLGPHSVHCVYVKDSDFKK